MTQSTVDKYLDDILLNTVYTVAHEDTLMEMGLDPDTVQETEAGEKEKRRGSQETGEKRRASTGAQGAEGRGGKERSAVKQRMKATQKKYLSAAHDQIWGMLDTFKQRGEVRKSL